MCIFHQMLARYIVLRYYQSFVSVCYSTSAIGGLPCLRHVVTCASNLNYCYSGSLNLHTTRQVTTRNVGTCGGGIDA